jgi:transcription elongation factor Elf1
MLKFFSKKIVPINLRNCIRDEFNVCLKINYNSYASVSNSYLNKNTKFPKFNFCSKNSKNEMSDKEEDDIAISKTEYDFLHLNENPNFNPVNSLLNHVKCQGCGIHLQTSHKDRIGFIPQNKLQEFIDASDNKKKVDEELSEKNDLEKIDTLGTEIPHEPLKEFELIHDKATLKRLMKLKNSNNVIICERCYKLKNYSKFEDLKDYKEIKDMVLKENKNKKNENDKINNYTLLVKKINTQRLIHQIMTRISNKAHIFYVCVSKFESF